MANADFSEVLPEILPHVIGCSGVMAVNAVRNSAVEFCERTLFWQGESDPTSVTDTDFPYTVDAPSGARVVQVLSLIVDGVPVGPTSLDVLNTVAQWRDHTGPRPSAYFQIDPEQVSVYPRLSTSAELIVRAAYAPSTNSTAVAGYVLRAHLETIAAGALHRLMTIPGQPFSNPELGQVHRATFQRRVTAAQIGANKAFGRAQLVISRTRFV